MAHKKAAGSTRNGRDSNPKMLGRKNLWRSTSCCW
jgi:ribosomal protein L27